MIVCFNNIFFSFLLYPNRWN